MQHKIKTTTMNNSKTSTVILCELALIALTCCLSLQQAQAAIRESGSVDPTTTQVPPSSSLEDPANSATTGEASDDDVCYRCYDVVKTSQNMVAIQEDLVNKQTKLIRQKQKAAAAAAAAATSNSPSTSTSASVQRKPRSRQRGENSTQSDAPLPQNRVRSLENQPIVVSRLRVARSPYSDRADIPSGVQSDSLSFNSWNAAGRVPSTLKNIKDSTMKQLKHKQDQQLNETCKSLYSVQQCLSRIYEECLGDLQFHSQEVYARQMLVRLNCPSPHDPTVKPFKYILKSIPRIHEPEKVPIPRPISSEEEIKRKLDLLLGGRQRSPTTIGVMLKPTLTTSASQKFNLISGSGPQQQQLLDATADGYTTKLGRHLASSHQIMNGQSNGHLVGMTSQLLLVPAFLALLVLFVIMASSYFKTTTRV